MFGDGYIGNWIFLNSDKVFLTGENNQKKCYSYTFSAQLLEAKPPMLYGRGTHGLCRIRKLLYVIGGNAEANFGEIGETYDRDKEEWKPEPSKIEAIDPMIHQNLNSNTYAAVGNDEAIYIYCLSFNFGKYDTKTQ